MITAAMLDPVAAQVVRTGRIVTAFRSTGVSELDVDGVVAVPEAIDVRATPTEDEAEDSEPVALHVVPDGGAKLAAAEDALEEATAHVTAAEQELAEAEGAVEELNARRLQLQGEAASCGDGSRRSRTTSTRSTRTSRRPRTPATTRRWCSARLVPPGPRPRRSWPGCATESCTPAFR